VVQRPGGRAADDADTQRRGAQQQQDAPNRGALAGASCPDLVLLELAVGVENQDPDGIAFGDPGVLQRDRGVVGREFIWEDSQYQLFIGDW
jgi:hypothetical protein